SEMDGVSRSNDRVLVMAATNAPWHVDPALLRPGRFDRVQFIPTPDEGARRAILALHLADRPTAADVNIEKLAKKTPDFSGADLADLVERGTEAPLREALVGGEMRPIRQRDLQQALAKSRPSTRDWFQTAKNYATFANVGGLYDDLTAFLERR
ncbi:MAG: ATP-binding protein, partial [Myxococcota bacterium]